MRKGWICAAVLVCSAAATGSSSASSGDLCVGSAPGCFASIQAAVDAAHDGDTIELGVGTFAGGITITKSVSLVGVSAAATVIRGGGPVVTIGEFEGTNDEHVAISRVTVTGGVNDSPGVADGGGIRIPQSSHQGVGATVTIDHSTITDNRAAPRATFASPAPCGATPFDRCAFASGGGIANAGTLTLTDSRVTGNVAGSPGITSSAGGGGIVNGFHGTLNVIRTVVSDNRAAVSAPNGRFSEGGGISDGGVLVLEDSTVDGNTSVAVSSVAASVFPVDVEASADAGGVDIGEHGTATIRGSSISNNSVSAFNDAGDVEGLNGGIDDDGSLELVDSTVDGNSVAAEVPAASGFVAGAAFGGVHIGAIGTIRSSRVVDNGVRATSASGTVFAIGGGVANFSAQLTVDHTVVAGNSAGGTGAAGLVAGGGILNTATVGPAPVLTVTDSVVTANRLSGSPSLLLQGAGIFSRGVLGGDFDLTLIRTVVEGNRPDGCAGC